MATDHGLPSERSARLRTFDNDTVTKGFAVLPHHCIERSSIQRNRTLIPREGLVLFDQWESNYTCLMQLCLQLCAVILQS